MTVLFKHQQTQLRAVCMEEAFLAPRGTLIRGTLIRIRIRIFPFGVAQVLHVVSGPGVGVLRALSTMGIRARCNHSFNLWLKLFKYRND